jgi:dephospho-CoA kinase
MADTQDANSISRRRLPVIGIVGGIGSGKSTVTRWAADHSNAVMIDADRLGHEALRLDAVKEALARRFGRTIWNDQGEIERGALARIVFGDSETHREARRDLERIVHPAIERQIEMLIDQAERELRDAVLLDAAVLFEAGWQNRCDAVVFVDAPVEVRQRRVAARSGWSPAELQRREASQLTNAEKKLRSDLVISNASDDTQAGQELLHFLHRIRESCCKQLPNSSQQS